MQIKSSKSFFGKIKIFNGIFVKSLFVSLWFIGLTYVECTNSINQNEPDVAKFSNKKAGIFEAGLHLGWYYKAIGLEVEGGLGLNLGNGICKCSEEIKLPNPCGIYHIRTDTAFFKQNILYGYLTPKITMQISRFVLKVGPRFQWGSIGVLDNWVGLDKEDKDLINKLKFKTFNVSLQIEIACAINKNVAAGLRFVWSPSHKLKYREMENDYSYAYEYNQSCKTCWDTKYSDLSVSFYIAGHYKSTKGFVCGADCSIGWKMSKLSIDKLSEKNNTSSKQSS